MYLVRRRSANKQQCRAPPDYFQSTRQSHLSIFDVIEDSKTQKEKGRLMAHENALPVVSYDLFRFEDCS